MLKVPKKIKIAIKDLIEYPNNPKLHPDNQVDQIKASIQSFGLVQDIVINKDNVVIIGHGRIQALKKLGIKEIEVSQIDYLDEKQESALRIADNKINSNSDFDFSKLKDELDALTFDNQLLTGFSKTELDEFFKEEKININDDILESNIDDNEDQKEDEDNKTDYFNLHLANPINLDNVFEIPKIYKQKIDIDKLKNLPLTPYTGENDNKDCILCFYTADKRFQCFWNDPNKYLDFLKTYPFIIGTDFSVYNNYPQAVQIYNTWRNAWIVAYWQKKGISVIPNIRWAEDYSFKYCFDHIEKGSIVSVGALSHKRDQRIMDMFINGFIKMIEIIQPEYIVYYGEVIDILKRYDNIIYKEPFQFRIRERFKNKKDGEETC